MENPNKLNKAFNKKNLRFAEIVDDSPVELNSITETNLEGYDIALVHYNLFNSYESVNIYGGNNNVKSNSNQIDTHDLYIDHSEVWVIFAKVIGTCHPYPWSDFYLFIALKRAFYNQFGVPQLNSLSSLNFMAGLDLKNRTITSIPFFKILFNPEKLPVPILKLISVSRKSFKEFRSSMRVLGVLLQIPFVFPKKREKPYRSIQRHLEMPLLIKTTGPLPWIQTIIIIIIPFAFSKTQNSLINCLGTLETDKILFKHNKVNHYFYKFTNKIDLICNRINGSILTDLYGKEDIQETLHQWNFSDHLELCLKKSWELYTIRCVNKNLDVEGNIKKDDNIAIQDTNKDPNHRENDGNTDGDKDGYGSSREPDGGNGHAIPKEPGEDGNGSVSFPRPGEDGNGRIGFPRPGEDGNGSVSFPRPGEDGNGSVSFPRPGEDGNGRIGFPRPGEDGNGRIGFPRPGEDGNGSVSFPRPGEDGNGRIGFPRPGEDGNGPIANNQNENRSENDSIGKDSNTYSSVSYNISEERNTFSSSLRGNELKGKDTRINRIIEFNNFEELNSGIFNNFLNTYELQKINSYQGLGYVCKLYQNQQYQKIKPYIKPYDPSYQILVNHINQKIILPYDKTSIIKDLKQISNNKYQRNNLVIYKLKLWYDGVIKWEKDQPLDGTIIVSISKNLYLRLLEFLNKKFLNFYEKSLLSLINQLNSIVSIQTIKNVKILQQNIIYSINILYNTIYSPVYSYTCKNISYIYNNTTRYVTFIFEKFELLSYELEEKVNPYTTIIDHYISNSKHINQMFLLLKKDIAADPSIKKQIINWNNKLLIEPLIINTDDQKYDTILIISDDKENSVRIDSNIEFQVENKDRNQDQIDDKELNIDPREGLLKQLEYPDSQECLHQKTTKFDHLFIPDLQSNSAERYDTEERDTKSSQFDDEYKVEEDLLDQMVEQGYKRKEEEFRNEIEVHKVSTEQNISVHNPTNIEEILQIISDFKFQSIQKFQHRLNNEFQSPQTIQEDPNTKENINNKDPNELIETDKNESWDATKYRSIANFNRVLNTHNILLCDNDGLSDPNKLSKQFILNPLEKANKKKYLIAKKILDLLYSLFKKIDNIVVKSLNANYSRIDFNEYIDDLNDSNLIHSITSLLSNSRGTGDPTIFMFNHLLYKLSSYQELINSLIVESKDKYKVYLGNGKKQPYNKKIDTLINHLLLGHKDNSTFLSLQHNMYHFDEFFTLPVTKQSSLSNDINIISNKNSSFSYSNRVFSDLAFIKIIKELHDIANQSYSEQTTDNNFLLSRIEDEDKIDSNRYVAIDFSLEDDKIEKVNKDELENNLIIHRNIEPKQEKHKYDKFDTELNIENIKNIENIENTFDINSKDSFFSSRISDSSSLLEFYGKIILTPQGYNKISDLIEKLQLILNKIVNTNIVFLESITKNKKNDDLNLIEYRKWIISPLLSDPRLKYIVNSFNLFLFRDIYNEFKINNLFSNLLIKPNYSLAILTSCTILFLIIASSTSILVFFYWTWRKLEDCINIEFSTRYTESKILIDQSIIRKFRKISVKPIIIPTGGPIIDTYKAFYSLYMYKKIVPQRLMHTKSGDLLRLERSTAEKYVITSKALLKSTTNLKQKIGRSDYYGSLIDDHALNTLQGYTTTYHSSPTFLLKHRLVSCTYKYIYYAVHSYIKSQRLAESLVLTNLKPEVSLKVIHKRPWALFPISFETFPSRAYLIVGNQNAGKTYLTKSLAANINLSLVYISIEKVLSANLDLQAEINFYSNSGMQPLLDHRQSELRKRRYERLIKMQVLFRLAEKISPCIVWMPLLERYTSNVFRDDATLGIAGLSLMMIVKTMQKTFNRDVNPNIMFVGGSQNTRELDPILLHPQRFDTLVRLDNPTPPEREISILSLLHTEGIEVARNFKFETIQNATMGYTMRHIGSLVDNILRTCKNLDSTVIDTILMNEVVQRQQVEWDISHAAERKYIASHEFVAYKVGKAIVKKQILPQPLFHSKSFWQIKFYYLSKWFLETRPEDSVVTEILMLPYFYSSLAGIAARDAWMMISLGRLSENAVACEFLEDDIDIALNLFRAYYSELGFLSFNNKNSLILGKQMIFSPDIYWKTGRLLSILGQFDISTAHHESSNISIEIAYEGGLSLFSDSDINKFIKSIVHWSPYFARVPMYRSFLLDVEKHVNQVPSIYSLVRYGTAEQLSKTFRTRLTDEEYWRLPEQHFYRINNIEPNLAQRLVDHAGERKRFMERRAEEMEYIVDSQNDTADRTEYYNPYESVFAISGICIWDPQPVHPRHLEFLNRDLVANRLMMSTLYSIYEEKLKSDINPFLFVRKPFWFRDEAKEKQEALIKEKLDAAREENTYIKEFLAERKQLLMELENFHTHKLIARINSTLLRPKCYTNIEGTFDFMITNNPLEGTVRYNVLFDEELYQATKGIQLEIFIHKHLLDTYNGLYKWFIKHQSIFAKLTDILYNKGVLWPEQIDKFGKENGLAYLEEVDTPILPYAKYLQDQPINLRVWYNLSMRNLFQLHL